MARSRSARRARLSATRYGLKHVLTASRRDTQKAKGAQEAHEAIRPTIFAREPDRLADELRAEQCRLYELIWQRASGVPDGRRRSSRRRRSTSTPIAYGTAGFRATRTIVRWLFGGLHRGHRRRRRGGRAPAADADPGRADDRRATLTPDAALHPAAAALHRGVADQGARGARHRPAVDLRGPISTIIDRGYVTRRSSAACDPSTSAKSSPTCWSSTSASSSTTTSRRAWRTSSTQSRRASAQLGAAAARVLRPFASLVDAKSEELKRSDFTTEETDEVCSEGHPMVIRLGRNGRFLACSLYPEHKRDAAAARRRGGDAADVEGVGETCPECGQGTLVARARTVRSRSRAARAIRTASTSARPGRRRPSRCRSRSPAQVRRGPSDGAPSAPDRHRLLGLLALSEVRLHLVARAARRRSTTLTTALSRATARSGGICLKCGAPIELPVRLRARPEARRRRAEPRGACAGRGAAARGGETSRGAHASTTASNARAQRRRPTRPARGVTGAEALEAFLGRLAARDSSETHPPGLSHGDKPIPRLSRGAPRRLAQSRPRPLVRGYLAEL